MGPSPQDDLILEPANADDFETIYHDDFNETMSGLPPGVQPYIRLNSHLLNATKEEGQKFSLRCEVAAAPTPVAYRWEKNNAPLEQSGSGRRRFKVKTSRNTLSSTLRIKDVQVLDTGYYACIATNAAGLSVNATAVLKVTPGASIRRPSAPSSPRKTPPSHDSGRLPRPSSGGHGSGGGPLGSELRLGQCVLYQGESCADFLRGQKVMVTTTDREALLDIERNVKAMMMFVRNMDSAEVSADCGRLSHRIACFHMYSLCDPEPADPRDNPALPICAADCTTISTETCSKGFSLAKEANMIGAESFLPDCAALDPRAERCVPVLDERPGQQHPLNPTHWCYVGRGRSYRGTSSRTTGGAACLPWDSVAPGRLDATAAAELRGAGAFCRNPGGAKSRPWCYSGPSGEEANCDIPLCPDDLFPELRRLEAPPPPPATAAAPPDGPANALGDAWNALSSTWQVGILAGGGGGLVLLLLLLFCLCCKCCRRSKTTASTKGGKLMNGSAATHPSYLLNNSGTSGSGNSHNRANFALFPGSGAARQSSLAGHGMELNSLLPPAFPPPQPGSSFGASSLKVSVPQIPQTHLAVGEALGEGSFGSVWKGDLSGYGGGGAEEPVAVAVVQLAADSLPRRTAEWAAEVERSAQLRHPNVLELVGALGSDTLVFDFAVHGDLHKFLLVRSPYSGPPDAPLDGDQLRADQTDFLHIATQIASGMEYLGSFGVVHGDLAARSCFVSGRQNVKLANFGLKREAYAADYARLAPGGPPVPARWMPPQNGPYPAYSVEADVWAFGVTLWEIHSYGTQPYFGYNDVEVGELIRSRHLLECPDNCPSRMYSLMVECWHSAGGRRPGFEEISSRLATWTHMSSPAASSALSGRPYHPNGYAPGGHQSANRSGSVHSGTSTSVPTSTQGGSGNPHHIGPHAMQTLMNLQASQSGKSPAQSQRSANNNIRFNPRFPCDSSTSGGD